MVKCGTLGCCCFSQQYLLFLSFWSVTTTLTFYHVGQFCVTPLKSFTNSSLITKLGR